MRASVALPSSADAAATVTAWLARVAAFVERRRWWIVGVCIVGQWVVLWRANVHHNGWLFQHGDDGPWYWTTAWAQTTLHVPFTAIGPGWPYVLTPVAAIFGPDMANGMPAVIALNVLVLGPASVIGMYLVAERIAGRLFAVWSAVLWTLMPTLAMALYSDSARHVIVDSFLPTATGLNALSDYPSMVVAIFCAYFVLRTMDSNDLRDGVLCGLLLGFLVLLKPANGPLPLAAVLVLLATRRFRGLVGVVGAAIPAAIALSIWKKTGTGQVPAISGGGGAGGGGGGGATPGGVAHNTSKYLNIDLHHLSVNIHDLGQAFWSVRLLEFLLVAGAFGLITRARWRGAFVVAWFLAFALIKGTVSYANVFDTSLYRFLLPAWPAWTLIVAGVVFCWPVGAARWTRRSAKPAVTPPSARVPGVRTLSAAAAVLSVAPLLLILAVSPAKRGAIVDANYTGAPIAAVDFGLRAHRTGPHTVRLEWRSMKTPRAQTRYAIFKGADDGCVYSTPAVPLCRFRMQLIGAARGTSFVDSQAVTKRLYRIGLVAGPEVQVDNPALLLVSKPLTVNVG
ncbi:MAG TPA: glycosyltransferase family 39 protein [Gaiellaceae bacterium]|jgi:hypothetical protein|nr:glycosyltransferase family 39 protein [Gaiellaceae bacterium]